FINNNLEEKLTLETLSSISNFSPFHFHRIMRAHLGESIGEYILRIRLNTAAQLLRFSNETVQDISIKVGYETPSSLNKAFKKRFDLSPLEFRSKQAQLQPDINIIKLDLQTMEKFKLNPKIAELKDKKVIFIQSIGKYGDNKTADTWNKLMDYVKKNKLFSWRVELFGISHDDPNITETDKCRYDACVTVSKEIKPEGEIGFKKEFRTLYSASPMKVAYLEVPDMKYLSVNGKGHPEGNPEFQEAIEALYGTAYTLKFMLKKNPELQPKNYFDFVN
ncbi:unnamed protein product, partial [marine sediment metagenome]